MFRNLYWTKCSSFFIERNYCLNSTFKTEKEELLCMAPSKVIGKLFLQISLCLFHLCTKFCLQTGSSKWRKYSRQVLLYFKIFFPNIIVNLFGKFDQGQQLLKPAKHNYHLSIEQRFKGLGDSQKLVQAQNICK